MEATMQCPTIDREMPVERCVGYRESGLYPCCLNCTVSKAGINQSSENTTIREGSMGETKECSKCKKPKPIERFSRLKKGEEKRKPNCMDCEAEYQRDRKAKKRALEEEHQRELHNIKLIEDHVTHSESNEGKQAEPAPAQNETGNWKLETGGQPGFETRQEAHGQDAHATISSNQLTLDFSCYPEVLKEIKRIAHHEERPAEVQARFMLKRLLQDGWSDEVGAAGGGCPVPLPHYEPMFIGVDRAMGSSAGGTPASTPHASPLTPNRSEAACG